MYPCLYGVVSLCFFLKHHKPVHRTKDMTLHKFNVVVVVLNSQINTSKRMMTTNEILKDLVTCISQFENINGPSSLPHILPCTDKHLLIWKVTAWERMALVNYSILPGTDRQAQIFGNLCYLQQMWCNSGSILCKEAFIVKYQH